MNKPGSLYRQQSVEEKYPLFKSWADLQSLKRCACNIPLHSKVTNVPNWSLNGTKSFIFPSNIWWKRRDSLGEAKRGNPLAAFVA